MVQGHWMIKAHDCSTKDFLSIMAFQGLYVIWGWEKLYILGENKYFFVIVDDYSKFICTLSLKSKVETLQMFTNFAKKKIK